jgi:hypothetical protein
MDFAKAAGKILKAHGIVEPGEPKSLPLEQVDGMVSAVILTTKTGLGMT